MIAEIKVKKLRAQAVIPAFQSAQAAGADLYICWPDGEEEGKLLWPEQRALVPTGLAIQLPAGYEGQIRPRSGLALNKGMTVLNTPGTVDADYRGEIKVVLINLGSEAVPLRNGDRIAQLVVAPVTRMRFTITDTLEDTVRGSGGFGSTG